jgi:hypothetical protein
MFVIDLVNEIKSIEETIKNVRYRYMAGLSNIDDNVSFKDTMIIYNQRLMIARESLMKGESSKIITYPGCAHGFEMDEVHKFPVDFLNRKRSRSTTVSSACPKIPYSRLVQPLASSKNTKLGSMKNLVVKRSSCTLQEINAIRQLTLKLGTHHWSLFKRDLVYGPVLKRLSVEQIRQFITNIRRRPHCHPEYKFLFEPSFLNMEKALNKEIKAHSQTDQFDIVSWYKNPKSSWN